MKRFSILCTLLLTISMLFADNDLKYIWERVEVSGFPFYCIKHSRFPSPAYAYHVDKCKTIPTETYEDLGLTKKNSLPTIDFTVFRRFKDLTKRFDILAVDMEVSEWSKKMLMTYYNGELIDFIECEVGWSNYVFAKQWRIETNGTIIITWLKVTSEQPVIALSDFTSVNAQRIDTYYEIDGNGKFREQKQVKFQPQLYTRAALSDRDKNLWKGNEIPIDISLPAQKTGPLYALRRDSIAAEPGYVEPFYIANRNSSPFLFDTVCVEPKEGAYSYVVRLFNNVEDLHDPGFFRGIDIESGGERLLSLKQSEVWDTLRGDAKKYASNPYFLAVPVSKTSTALIFTGYPYPSAPELVTIVLLDKDRAALVFNKEIIVRNIEYTKDTFVMDLQDIMFEYIDPDVPANAPQLYRVFKENGVLKFGGPYGILRN